MPAAPATAGGPRTSLRARLLVWGMRRALRPVLARETDPVRARQRFLESVRWVCPDPPFALFLPDRMGSAGPPALWASAGGAAGGGVILYLHGGAFVMGSPRTHRALAARLAAQAGMAALLPQYRRAPEHPFPAALEDALACYRALLERGYAPGRIALAGDSAGGGLALSLLAEIAGRGLPLPAALVGFSPLVDLTFSGASWQGNRSLDAMLPAERGADVAAMWLQGADPADPRASPLFADWEGVGASGRGLPPVLLFAAGTELLRDDALRMAARLRAAGGWAEARLAGDLPHVWPFLSPWLPEACSTLREAGRFLAERLRPGAATGGRAPPGPGAQDYSNNLAAGG